MISTRVFAILFLFVAFGLFAYAAPVESIAARSATCDAAGCNEVDLLDLLVVLKAKIHAHVALLDGVYPFLGPCNDIIAEINACVALILAVKVDISGLHGSHYTEICSLIAEIIHLIVSALIKYNIVAILAVCVRINICLGAFISACATIIPGLPIVVGTLLASVDVSVCAELSLHLVLALFGL